MPGHRTALWLFLMVGGASGEVPQSQNFVLVREGAVAGATTMSSGQYRLELLTLAGEASERSASASHSVGSGPLPQSGSLPSAIFGDGFETAD